MILEYCAIDAMQFTASNFRHMYNCVYIFLLQSRERVAINWEITSTCVE